MPQIIPYIPLILGVATTAYSGISGHQQEVRAHEHAREQMARWRATAFPSSQAVREANVQNRGELGQARLGAYQSMASQLASRGAGPGSGLMQGGAENIESNYLKALGKSSSDITRWAHTPGYYPPGVTMGGPSGWGAAGQTGGDIMQSALGWYLMKNYFGGGGTGTTNFYDYSAGRPSGW